MITAETPRRLNGTAGYYSGPEQPHPPRPSSQLCRYCQITGNKTGRPVTSIHSSLKGAGLLRRCRFSPEVFCLAGNLRSQVKVHFPRVME